MRKCFLDFDHTLFATDRLFYVEVKNDLKQLGIDESIWQKAYEEIWSTGYSLAKHVEAINRQTDKTVSLEQLMAMLRNDLSGFVYPDVVPWLKQARQQGIELYLLSFGSPDWQKYKLEASGLSEFFDDIFITASEGKKVDVIVDRARESELIVVDNNPAELDLVRDALPETKTYLIERVTFEQTHNLPEIADLATTECRRYLEKEYRHAHVSCQALIDIVLN